MRTPCSSWGSACFSVGQWTFAGIVVSYGVGHLAPLSSPGLQMILSVMVSGRVCCPQPPPVTASSPFWKHFNASATTFCSRQTGRILMLLRVSRKVKVEEDIDGGWLEKDVCLLLSFTSSLFLACWSLSCTHFSSQSRCLLVCLVLGERVTPALPTYPSLRPPHLSYSIHTFIPAAFTYITHIGNMSDPATSFYLSYRL